MRCAVAIGALEAIDIGCAGNAAAEFEPGDHVADSGKSGAGDGRILGSVDQFVDAAGIEAGWKDEIVRAVDVPVTARDGGARPFHHCRGR